MKLRKKKENEIAPKAKDGKIAYRGKFVVGNMGKKLELLSQHKIKSMDSYCAQSAKLDQPLPANTNLSDIYWWKFKMVGKDCGHHFIGVVSDKCGSFETGPYFKLTDSFGITSNTGEVYEGTAALRRVDDYGDHFKSGDVVCIEYHCKDSMLIFSRLEGDNKMKKIYEMKLPTQGITNWYPATSFLFEDVTAQFIACD